MKERNGPGTGTSKPYASSAPARPPVADLGSARGEPVLCDLGKLAAGRLFVLANSGGGKTRLLRRLLEQSWGLIQHIVIDPDGQLATLGEVFDYLVLDADRIFAVSAADLALSIREGRYSVVLDLSEADANDKLKFVGDFLTALIGCPRETWRSTLVVIDEAQVLASFGSTSAEIDDDCRKVCVNAIADLNGRGRKRGLVLVVSSLRIATLAKGALAGIQNFLVGGCSLDIDAGRAAGLIGLERSKKSVVQTLPIGRFIAYGPALSPVPTRFKVGEVKSRHPGTPALDSPPALSVDDARRVFDKIPRKPERATVSEIAEYLFDRGQCDGLLLDLSRNGKFEVDPRAVLERANALREEEGKAAFAISDLGNLKATEKGTVKIEARWVYKTTHPRSAPACRSLGEGRREEPPCSRSAVGAPQGRPNADANAKSPPPPMPPSALSPGASAKEGASSSMPPSSGATGAALERRLRAVPSTLNIVEVAAMLKVDVDDAQRMANACGLRFAESTLPIKVEMPDVVEFLESMDFKIIQTTSGGYLVNGKFSYDGPHLVALANRERGTRGLVAYAVSGSGPVQRGKAGNRLSPKASGDEAEGRKNTKTGTGTVSPAVAHGRARGG